MRRYLVVGNQTLGSEELLAEMRRRAEGQPCQFHVVVPMAHPAGAWSEGSAHAAAQPRLDAALQRFRDAGLDVTGEVGDASPVAAVGDALLATPGVEAIIVSTLAPSTSVWLNSNVIRRITKEHPSIPVIHVVPEPVAIG